MAYVANDKEDIFRGLFIYNRLNNLSYFRLEILRRQLLAVLAVEAN